MWWMRSEQTNRNAAWYSMNGITNMVGSLISYGLGHIHSEKLHSYQVSDVEDFKLTIHR